MSTLHGLKRPSKSWHRKKRIGRGQGSGWGKTAGRGGKGQKARSGNMHFEGFEGGQSPLQRRSPKFGFLAPNRIYYGTVNISKLEQFEAGSTIDEASLRDAGLVRGRWDGVKILGHGTLTKKLNVKVHAFTAKGRELIEKAGGTIEVIPRVAHRPEGESKAHSGKGVKKVKSAAV